MAYEPRDPGRAVANYALDDPRLHNLDAEAALLGALMIDNRTVETVLAHMSGDDFFEPLHGDIFGAILQLVDEGRPANPVTLRPLFEKHPALTDVGGTRYLAQMTEQSVALLSVNEFAKEIADYAKRRELVRQLQEVQKSIIDEPGTALDEIITKIDTTAARVGGDAGHMGVRVGRVAKRVIKNIAEVASGERARGVMSPLIPDWEKVVGPMAPGNLIILGGRPSMGKTLVASGVAIGAAMSGVGVEFISLDMTADDLTMRMIADMAFTDPATSPTMNQILENQLSMFTQRAVNEAEDRLANLPLFISDPARFYINRLPGLIRARQKQCAALGVPLGLVVVDYLTRIYHPNPKLQTRQRVAEVTQALKDTAKETGVPIVALSQLSRAIDDRPDKRPTLSDLREAGDIEEIADAVVFVYRDEYYLVRNKPIPGTPDFEAWKVKLDESRGKLELIGAKTRMREVSTSTVNVFLAHQCVRGSDFYDKLNRETYL